MLNLIILILYLQADRGVAAEKTWTVEIPESVTGLKSSCVVVPCRYDYPHQGESISSWKGRWYLAPNDVYVYDQDSSTVDARYQMRTALVGELREKNCSLQITDIKKNDQGQYWFRIMMEGYNSYSYSEKKITISVKDEPNRPSISGVIKEVRSGEIVTVSCSASHSCPPHPPTITWSRDGRVTVQSEPLTGGQHKLTSSLSFNANASDHQQPITCSVQHHGGKKAINSVILKVTYAPVNVTISPREPSVLENGSISLSCLAEGNPEVDSYQWRNGSGPLSVQGKSLKLSSVTRRIHAITCVARNREGETASRPVRINVEYPPEISEQSFCTRGHSGTQCSCTVQSNPPSIVRWVWDHGENESPQIKNGTTAVAMDLLPPNLHQAVCMASNKHGNAMKILYIKNDLLYVYVSVGAGCALILFLTVICLSRRKRCRQQQQNLERENSRKKCEKENHVYNSQEVKGGQPCCVVDEDLYGNEAMQDADDDGEIYANNCHGCGEDDDIYANC
ncbi:sialic acid-binding Ig-like lectin 13 isoform X1 [Alosa sapidissima]|uniref:sialic acid-binding Ig-like lectin 13 isoform X1 n=1 Tax=Alosa sapidissima TaxID=34773 RepID=UPI001C0830E2|nr:sialic acid-binding Ig-like lectin 13 isoform X1 [Alosa sapidissima]XP_041941246.1 sialic acid-binding Ig-like lectin 13 isoform X1 [Alosa sapidissima]